MGFGTSCFLLPNQLSSGGFAGISTIVYYLFHVPMGITILILNIPLVVWSYLKVGKEVFYKTLIGTILLSTFIDLFDKIVPLTMDPLLGCIYGGIFMGIRNSLGLKSKGINRGDGFSYLSSKRI